MFGSIGVPELVLIFIVALLLFGPRKLPDIGRNIGRALGEFRRASNDLKRTIEEEVATEDLRQVARDTRAATSLPVIDSAPVAATPAKPPNDESGASAPAPPDGTPLEPR